MKKKLKVRRSKRKLNFPEESSSDSEVENSCADNDFYPMSDCENLHNMLYSFMMKNIMLVRLTLLCTGQIISNILSPELWDPQCWRPLSHCSDAVRSTE